MTNSVNGIANINKSGTCPHGAAPGACPICSGMGGGLRVGERPQKPGEMSYHECAMIGAMMRAREAQQKMHEQNLKLHAEALKAFEQSLINMAQKMSEFTANIQKHILLKPVAFIINNTLIVFVKTISNLPNFILNTTNLLNSVKEKLIDIQDKLNAIFGEAKAFIEKKVSEFIGRIKTNLNTLFRIFKRSKTKDDETKIDEDKKIFRLRVFIEKIFNKNKNQNETS